MFEVLPYRFKSFMMLQISDGNMRMQRNTWIKAGLRQKQGHWSLSYSARRCLCSLLTDHGMVQVWTWKQMQMLLHVCIDLYVEAHRAARVHRGRCGRRILLYGTCCLSLCKQINQAEIWESAHFTLLKTYLIAGCISVLHGITAQTKYSLWWLRLQSCIHITDANTLMHA